MAEGLHHQVGAEAQAGQVFELVAGHGAGGVLRADRGHFGFAVGAGAHALACRQATRAADHLLRQGEALLGVHRVLRQAEQGRHRQAQRFTRLGGQATANDQRNTATGTHFVKQHIALEAEFSNDFAVFQRLAFVRAQFHHVAHGHLAHVQLDRQRAGVFHGVVKNRGDLVAQADAAKTLVRHKGDVFAGEPQHRVGGRLAAGAGTDHVARIGHQMAACAQVFDELDRAALAVFFRNDARAGILVHGQSVHRNVRAAERIGRGRQVVGVDFTGHLEDADGDALGHGGAAGEPFGIGPALQHGFGVGVALFGLFLHVMELVEHQQGFLQTGSSGFGHGGRCVVQQVDHGADVVAAQHGSQQFGGFFTRQQRAFFAAVGHGGQVAGLDLGGIVYTGGDAVGDQIEQIGFFACGRAFQQLDQLAGLLGRQGQRRNAEGGALSNMGGIGLQHGFLLVQIIVGGARGFLIWWQRRIAARVPVRVRAQVH